MTICHFLAADSRQRHVQATRPTRVTARNHGTTNRRSQHCGKCNRCSRQGHTWFLTEVDLTVNFFNVTNHLAKTFPVKSNSALRATLPVVTGIRLLHWVMQLGAKGKPFRQKFISLSDMCFAELQWPGNKNRRCSNRCGTTVIRYINTPTVSENFSLIWQRQVVSENRQAIVRLYW